MKKKYKKERKNKMLLFPLLICIAMLFVGITYAALNATAYIKGSVSTTKQENIFITDVVYKSDVDADLANSQINSFYQTMLNSNVALSNTNGNSTLTYTVTIYNSSNDSYKFKEATFDEEFYDNSNIIISISGMDKGYELEGKSDKTFNVTFQYLNNQLPEDGNNMLESCINFYFDYCFEQEFNYTGNYETFVVPYTGIYKIELWGASGGNSLANGEINGYPGKGAYVSGDITLTEGEELYVYVGERGSNGIARQNTNTSYNGGGAGSCDSTQEEADGNESAGAGGGATDIRLEKGEWNNFNSLASRIMVAGGGAGALWTINGLYLGGAGLTSWVTTGKFQYGSNLDNSDGNIYEVTTHNTNQEYGYSFGTGQSGTASGWSSGVPGGGGGYYGGFTNNEAQVENIAIGGSSFISGHPGCYAIAAESTENNRINTYQSVHFSGYQFTNTTMIDGDGFKWSGWNGILADSRGDCVGMPTFDGDGTMVGNASDGFAKITLLETIE